MTGIKDAARVAILEKGVLDALQAANSATRAQMTRMLDVGEAVVGKLEDGTNLGKVRLKNGAESARVVDRDAFLAWVKATYPEMIQQVVTEQVYPANEKAILAAVKRDGGLTNRATGEIELVPGVIVKVGDPVLAVEVNTDTMPAVVDAILQRAGLKAIES